MLLLELMLDTLKVVFGILCFIWSCSSYIDIIV